LRAVGRDGSGVVHLDHVIQGTVETQAREPVPDRVVLVFAITAGMTLFLGRVCRDARGIFQMGLDTSTDLLDGAHPTALFFEVLEDGQLLAGQLVDPAATRRATNATVGDTFLPDALRNERTIVTLHEDLPVSPGSSSLMP